MVTQMLAICAVVYVRETTINALSALFHAHISMGRRLVTMYVYWFLAMTGGLAGVFCESCPEC